MAYKEGDDYSTLSTYISLFEESSITNTSYSGLGDIMVSIWCSPPFSLKIWLSSFVILSKIKSPIEKIYIRDRLFFTFLVLLLG